ncbi:ABC transporter permease [Paenibacillus larvae]
MFISIAKKEIKLLIKEKGTFFWLLVLPILFIVLFGSMSSMKTQAVKIPYMDQDQTTASRQFIQSLEQMKGIQTVYTKPGANERHPAGKQRKQFPGRTGTGHKRRQIIGPTRTP